MAPPNLSPLWRLLLLMAGLAMATHAQDASTVDAQASPGAAAQPQVSQPQAPDDTQPEAERMQTWNFHMQTTTTLQGYPSFYARYSGANSLPTSSEVRETVSLDLYSGFRLWTGAELHLDVLSWQGFGLGNALGVDDFTDGEAYKIGTHPPRAGVARCFIRQTIGLGGDTEDVLEDPLTLAGKQDISRLTFTIGRFSSKDVFDNNAYANDAAHTIHELGIYGQRCLGLPSRRLGLYDRRGD